MISMIFYKPLNLDPEFIESGIMGVTSTFHRIAKILDLNCILIIILHSHDIDILSYHGCLDSELV